MDEPPAEAEEGAPEKTPEEAVEAAEAALAHAGACVGASKVAVSNAEGKLATEDKGLDAIKEVRRC